MIRGDNSHVDRVESKGHSRGQGHSRDQGHDRGQGHSRGQGHHGCHAHMVNIVFMTWNLELLDQSLSKQLGAGGD